MNIVDHYTQTRILSKAFAAMIEEQYVDTLKQAARTMINSLSPGSLRITDDDVLEIYDGGQWVPLGNSYVSSMEETISNSRTIAIGRSINEHHAAVYASLTEENQRR